MGIINSMYRAKSIGALGRIALYAAIKAMALPLNGMITAASMVESAKPKTIVVGNGE